MEEIIARAIIAAKNDGADQAEVFASRSRTLSIYVDDSAIKNVEQKQDQGISVRVLKGKRIGQAGATCIAASDAERCATSASKLASLSPESKSYEGLPSSSRSQIAPRVWDEEIASLTAEDLSTLVRTVIEHARSDVGIKVPKGMIRTAGIETWVVNSNGVDIHHRNTMAYLDFSSMTSGPEPGEGVCAMTANKLASIDAVGAGTMLRNGATASQRASAFKGTMKGIVLIQPNELSQLLSSSAGSALSAENMHKKRSPWVGKIGESVASGSLSIMDDPSDGRGMLSSAYDDEGVAATKKELVKNGVLRSYLSDSYNASLDSVPPSGNGMRRSAVDSQFVFESPIAAGPLNMVVSAGNRSPEQMIADIDNGVLIERVASAEAHPITGAFALEVRCGHIIENGAITRTIDHALVVGNMFDALKNVREIGNDQTVCGNVIVPTIAFDGIELIGSG